MKRTTLRISDEEYAKVLEYAGAKEQSLNDVIRQIIRDWKPKYWLVAPLRFATRYPAPPR